jgi:hypothetical protein
MRTARQRRQLGACGRRAGRCMLEVEGEDNNKQGRGQVEPLQWSCDVTRDAGTDDCRSDGGNAATATMRATMTATTTTSATGRRHRQSADHGLVRRQPQSSAANNTATATATATANIGDIISYHVWCWCWAGLPLHRALHGLTGPTSAPPKQEQQEQAHCPPSSSPPCNPASHQPGS